MAGRASGLWSRHTRPESSSEGPVRCGDGGQAICSPLQGTRNRTRDGLEYLEVEGRKERRRKGEKEGEEGRKRIKR